MRRRKSYDAFSPATNNGGTIPADPSADPGSKYAVNKKHEATENNDANDDETRDEKTIKKFDGATPHSIELHYGNWPLWRVITPAVALFLGNINFQLIRWPQFFNSEMRKAAEDAVDGRAPWMTVESGASSILFFPSSLLPFFLSSLLPFIDKHVSFIHCLLPT